VDGRQLRKMISDHTCNGDAAPDGEHEAAAHDPAEERAPPATASATRAARAPSPVAAPAALAGATSRRTPRHHVLLVEKTLGRALARAVNAVHCRIMTRIPRTGRCRRERRLAPLLRASARGASHAALRAGGNTGGPVLRRQAQIESVIDGA